MLDFFGAERRRERLEDRLGDARDRLDTAKLFQRNHGGHRAEIRGWERTVARHERRLARFNAKHDGPTGGAEDA